MNANFPASKNHVTICMFFLLLSLMIVSYPVSASFIFQNIIYDPSTVPLLPGQKETVNTELVIIPQGATSFIESNQLELTTQLEAAQWNVQVMVNGIPAAQIPVSGNTVFVNGYLLSYPSTSDVAVSISVSGIVPGNGDPSIILVQAVQLNNQGLVVPGSTETISQVVSVPTITLVPGTSAAPVPTTTARTPTPTKAAGFPGVLCSAGFFICATILWQRSKTRV